MLVMSRPREIRKPMKPQKTKIPAFAHEEFVSALMDEFLRLRKKNKFFGQSLPSQTIVSVVLSGFLEMPEDERDRWFTACLRRYEDGARLPEEGEGEEAGAPPKTPTPIIEEMGSGVHTPKGASAAKKLPSPGRGA